MRLGRASIVVLALVFYAWAAFAADFQLTRRVTYVRRGMQRQMLDIYVPAGATTAATPRPAVLVIHGGGFVGGVRGQMDDLCRAFVDRGLVVFNVDYRLGPWHTFPAGIEDVRCAMRFVGAHARDYGADPDNIGVTGESAGAYLSAMVAYPAAEDFLDPGCPIPGPAPTVRAAALYYGVYDLDRAYYLPFTGVEPMLDMALWARPTKNPARYAQYAVEPVVEREVKSGRTLPPTLLLTGDVDPLYPETLLLYQKLKTLGQDAELKTYPGVDHAFAIFPKDYPGPESRALVANWLADRLRR